MKNKKKLIQLIILLSLIGWQSTLLAIFVQASFQQKHYVWLREDKLVCILDFVRYYAAGQIARSSDRLRIYDLPVHLPYVNKLIAPFVIEHESSISFPPPAIAIMSVVSQLPMRTAYLVWGIGGLLFALATMFYFLVCLRKFSIIDSLIFCLGFSGSFVAFLNLQVGQWASWLAGFYLLFFAASLKKKEVIAGISLGILTVKPQYAFPLIAIVVAQKRYLTLVTTVLTAVALNIWGVQLIGLQNLLEYPAMMSRLSRLNDVGVVGPVQASLRGLFSNLCDSGTAYNISSALFWLMLLVLSAVLWKCRTQLNCKLLFWWALTMTLAMVFSPHSLNYDITLMCLPAVLTLNTLNPIEALKIKSVPLRFWHCIFISYPIITWIGPAILPKQLTFLYAFLNISMVITAILILKSKDIDTEASPEGSRISNAKA